MLNSTGVRYPLLFCSKLSKTVSSCSRVRGSSLWSRCKDKRTNKIKARLKSSLWLAPVPAILSFGPQRCALSPLHPGWDATLCQYRWVMTQIPVWTHWYGNTFNYWVIQPGLQRGNFGSFCLARAQPFPPPASEPLLLVHCLPPSTPAQRWLLPGALPASCDHCCSQESSLSAHQVPTSALWPETEDRLVGVWIQFPALAEKLTDHKRNVQSITES